ncbi:hypothetical protein FSARC_3695 [Fusarium sarcochroum]|uniref:Integral membrane protein n=1 Tax=Fusarium sarcochroum TaxID=1208366 RepID=A0A8H4U3B8_9HYPO|nr:hypothetical protein FSARC_3695 [Fusarium sarcochroum]
MASNPPYQTYQPAPPGQPSNQVPQSPQVQYHPQQYPAPPGQNPPPGQQPSYQAPTYGYGGPPTVPAQQQPQQQQQQQPAASAQFAPPPSAQAALQSSAQSLYKTGKGLLGNLASSIKSKYPAAPNTPTNTTSYTGTPPKPNYNPSQHPTQSPLSPSQLSHVPSFPQGYGQSTYLHHQPATPAQHTISPTNAGYPPAPYQTIQIASPGYSPGVHGQPPQPGYDISQSPYQQLQSPQETGLTSPPGATPQLPVQSPPVAASPYPQPQLHHQQSNLYQPTHPPHLSQSLSHAAAHVGSPGHGKSPPHVLPPQQHYQSPFPQQHQQPPYQQQTGLGNPYGQQISSPASQPFAQPAAHVALPIYAPLELHQQLAHQQTGLTSPYEPTTSSPVPQPTTHPAGSPGYVQSPAQALSPQQHHQSAVPPPHPQPLYNQPPALVNPHEPVTQAIPSPPLPQPTPHSAAYNDSASHAQSPPPAPPQQQHYSPVLQQPASPTPVPQSSSAIQPGAPISDGQYYPFSQEQTSQSVGAPVVQQLSPTPSWNHNPPPPGHEYQAHAMNSGPTPAGNQFQAYSPPANQYDPQAQYTQPLLQPTASAAGHQYHPLPPPPPPQGGHSNTIPPSQAPASPPAVAVGQNFQPYQPSPQQSIHYQPGASADNNAPSQQASNDYHQDLLVSLSAQMNNLNVQNGDQCPAAPGSGPPVKQDGPRGPPLCHASGSPCDTLPYCPEDRSVRYSLDWYRCTDVPKYLICTRCYADHVATTHLAGHFERFNQPDGTESTCGFWPPRAREILWPRALQTNDISPLRTFMEKSLSVPVCKGRVWSTGVDAVKWYGMANNEIDGFISCEACYEDRIMGTAFESRFSPYRPQGQDEKWMCDLCIPYLTTAAGKMSKQNDWVGFVEAAKIRIHLPACEGKEVEPNNGQWFILRRKIKDMVICEACYLDKLALTTFGHEFERHQQVQGFDAYMETLGQRWKCDLTDTAVNMSIALEAAIYRRDFDVFWNAANSITTLVPCTANGIIRGNWWTVAGGCPDVSVCEACYKGILETSGLEKFFEPAQRDATIDIVCTFCPASPRWGTFITKFAEALDKGVFGYYTDYVKKWAGVPTCPGIKDKAKSKWWGYPEALACQDCYLNFVADTSLGQSVPVVGIYDERSLICQLWSPRMRNMWIAACAAGPPGSPESQMALDEFRVFGSRRVQVYNATIPHIEMIEMAMMMKRQQAMQQGQLSLMYQGMNGTASLMGTTDGNWHGNSSIGYYETEHGVTAANMMNNMHSGLADANKMSDWMQIAQLKTAWMEVE